MHNDAHVEGVLLPEFDESFVFDEVRLNFLHELDGHFTQPVILIQLKSVVVVTSMR